MTLARKLARRIAGQGPMTVAEFMAAALTDPEQGYYMGRDPLGARGDFITAPEVSQMFGELIGLWCAETWQRLGAPDPIRLVELGPGRGTLMADALRAARALPGFLEAIELHLVEISPALKAAQAQRLGAFAPQWHDDLGRLPDGPLLLIANEFFDALPVRQFVADESGWRERLVGLAGAAAESAEPGFVFALSPPSALAAGLTPESLHAAPAGALFEVSPAALGLAAEIGRRLTGHGGAALIIDYGHTARAAGETLQALRRHRRHEVLDAPGSADLTCHVDFAALAEAATPAAAHGPLEQGLWLKRLGIESRAARLGAAASPAQRRDIAAALGRLTAPDQMGRLFKVLALTPPGLGPPAGFA